MKMKLVQLVFAGAGFPKLEEFVEPPDGQRRCSLCKRIYPEEFFRRKADFRPSRSNAFERQARCKGCEITARNEAKQRDRWAAKARDTLRRHSRRLGISVIELERKFGWAVDRIVHDMRHAYENTCAYCWEAYEAMGHGHADVTLDIVDPTREPFYRSNVRMCCQTCNREKSRMSPERWEKIRGAWAFYRDYLREKQPQPVGGPAA
jgi:5-methylcytosine-specific restriction endonuclease McrA